MNELPLHFRLMARFLRVFFNLLYHQMAWTYDLVANTVSLGMWGDWVASIIPDLRGPRVLELGHGPGRLQRKHTQKGILAFGIDESRQMGRMAIARLRKNRLTPHISRCYAQFIPFPDQSFDQIVATFPSEYIFDANTLAEARRVLRPGGEMIILPAAWITGKAWLERFAAWLFRVTAQSPTWDDRYLAPYRRAGFKTSTKRISRKSWELLVIVLENKKRQSPE